MVRGFRTRREVILGLPNFWREVYLKGGGGEEHMAAVRRQLEQFEALDLNTASREQVDAIANSGGSHGYTDLMCNGCGRDVEALVTVGEEAEVESRTANLCRDCVTEALGAFTVRGLFS